VHANINGHIIDGRLDRLFRGTADGWQTIRYETKNTQNLEIDYPEVALYGLLVHRSYPEQPFVTVNIFFTEQKRCEQSRFSNRELQTLMADWANKISALQRGNYQKNRQHCPSCPYADTDRQCIVTES